MPILLGVSRRNEKVKVIQSCPTLCDPLDCTVHGILQARILEWVAFPSSRGSNPVLLHCRRILYQPSHKRSPRILEWLAYPFSSKSSQPRNWSGVSCIAGGIFTNSAMREGLETSASLDKQNPTLARIPAHLIVCFFPHPLIVPLLVDYGVLPF